MLKSNTYFNNVAKKQTDRQTDKNWQTNTGDNLRRLRGKQMDTDTYFSLQWRHTGVMAAVTSHGYHGVSNPVITYL